ncbi:MAG: beta-hydroxyacyl-ACP dehydratase [Bacteroides sp.]|nr:beta-hydroxyacyl-ACP dehydratase [Bacteroides sp.]
MDCGDIRQYIPQRTPIQMVDRLTDIKDDGAETSFIVREDTYFVDENGRLTEPGLIEHIAQSASALAGYKAVAAGAVHPPIGYIGEVKKFRCYRCPLVGDELHTTITMGAEVDGVTIITGETQVDGKVMAATQMKIFMAGK